jgi:hypothetical protein
MKRGINFILAIVIFLGLSISVYGADLLYRLTHGDQDALVLGTVTEAEEEWITVDVERTLDGKEVDKHIKIYANKDRKTEPKFYWYVPQKGDFIVASIDKKSPGYEVKWGVFKVSSLDHKTLKIEKGLNNKSDNAIFQHYINNGCKVANYYIEEDKVYIKNDDGSVIQIYPTKDKDTPNNDYTDIMKEKSIQNNSSDVIENNENNENTLIVFFIFIAPILLISYTYFKKRK